MKIIVVTENGDLVREIVEKQGHAVAAQTDDVGQLVTLILHHTPHLVFLEKTSSDYPDVDHLRATFPKVRFVLLGFARGTTWTDIVRQALRRGKINGPWNTETPDQRQIVFDEGYNFLFSKATFKDSSRRSNPKTEGETQIFRLEWLLRTAAVVQKCATSFADAMAAIDSHEWAEIKYLTVCGSFQGSVFARDLLARDLALLSHYVPGCDLDGLPAPTIEPANLRFVHHQSSPESHYALFCLAIFGINADIAKQLYRAIHWRYEGESPEQLAETGIWMSGLAFTMRQLALAHVMTVNRLFALGTVDTVAASRSRALHRTTQMFACWWEFREVFEDADRLRALLQNLRAVDKNPPLPESLKIPNYAQFLEALRASNDTNPTQE